MFSWETLRLICHVRLSLSIFLTDKSSNGCKQSACLSTRRILRLVSWESALIWLSSFHLLIGLDRSWKYIFCKLTILIYAFMRCFGTGCHGVSTRTALGYRMKTLPQGIKVMKTLQATIKRILLQKCRYYNAISLNLSFKNLMSINALQRHKQQDGRRSTNILKFSNVRFSGKRQYHKTNHKNFFQKISRVRLFIFWIQTSIRSRISSFAN